MDEIKALDGSVGRSIGSVLVPTGQIFTPLLLKNRESIFSIPRQEHSYGSHHRQKLDVYLPAEVSGSSPILVFFYGGGLVRGDKINPMLPEPLVYHNLGSFYAQRGITTIIADYRRVNSDFGGEDAVYPSGGDDLSLVLKWLETFEHKGSGNLVLMGNSAGGVHLATFLFDPRYLKQRRSLASGERGIKLVGGVLLGAPFDLDRTSGKGTPVVHRYYGDAKGADENSPDGLLKAVERTGKSREDTAVPDLLVLVSEFDPEEIIGAGHEFVEVLNRIWKSGSKYEVLVGHNHISLTQALLSGDKEGEKWAEDVAVYIKGLNS